MQNTYIFDGTFDGFLTIIYGHYYSNWQPLDITDQDFYQQSLNTDYFFVTTNTQQSERVNTALTKKISNEFHENVCVSFLSASDQRFMPIYQYILKGFESGKIIDKHTHIDCVWEVQSLAKTVLREAHLQKEFIRFKETKSGVFYADISPKNNVLPILADHFRDRFNFPWIIHDVSRKTAILYDLKECVMTDVDSDAKVELSEYESYFQSLWQCFHNSIANPLRKNSKLQRQLNPLYFRKHMTEFNKPET